MGNKPAYMHGIQACTPGSTQGSQKGGYIVDTLYSFMQCSMMQSLQPVASPAYASKNLSI